MQWIHSIERYAYETRTDPVSETEEIKFNNVIKQYKKWLTWPQWPQIPDDEYRILIIGYRI